MMKILAVFLILAAMALAVLAGLRYLGWMEYNRRRRRRRKAPRPLDPFTRILFALAAVCLVAGCLTAFNREDSPGADPTGPQIPGSSQQTPSDTEPSLAGWQEENGVRYYRNADGSHALGWLELDGQRYYTGPDGAVRTGWQEIDGVTYYFKADGAMARGRVEIDGTAHFFTASGANVLLVNPWNPVPAGYTPDLVALDEYYGTTGMEVDRNCLDALTDMIDDCNAAGSRAYVLSSYRSVATQQRLFDRKVDALMGQGMNRDDARKEAAAVVAVPGTSEHHLGLAVDIIDTGLWALEEEQEDMPAQKWLMENSWRYGFIFRYPKDKTGVTGIIYEPWHYRYVGLELAQELHTSGLTLEEYLDSLN